MSKRIFFQKLYFIILSVLIIPSCQNMDSARTKEINNLLKENGFTTTTIKGKSEEEINNELFDLLEENHFLHFGGNYVEQSETADLIVKMKCYETVKKIISTDPYGLVSDQMSLALWIVIKIDALPKKTSEDESVLTLFLKRLEEKEDKFSFANRITNQIPFLKLYEEAPAILEKLYPNIITEYKLETKGSIGNSIIKSSKKLKNAIIKHDNMEYILTKPFPLSEVKNFLADFKPSNPQKGGFIFVFDDNEQKLPVRNEFISAVVSSVNVRRQPAAYRENGVLFPVVNPNDAQIIIYEKYFYEKSNELYNNDKTNESGTVYLRNTNVKVVNAITKKTIFDKTHKTTEATSYFAGPYNSAIGYRYDPREDGFTKEIAESVKSH